MEKRGHPFLGRGPELARLIEAMDRLKSGRGALFFVVGEPGIGKTRLADELTAEAVRRGIRVVWGRCWDGGGAPAYWPWRQLLDALTAGLDLEPFVAALPEAAAVLPSIAPALRARVPPASAETDAESARFALFQAVAALLRWATAATPLVMVLDDLHAADPSSIVLLEFLARDLRSLPLVLVGCHRDVDPHLTPELSHALARAGREGEPLVLRRLDRRDTAAFVEQAAGDLGAEATAAVFEATQGNPLFVAETLRLLSSERASADDPLPVHYGVREVIRRRLGNLAAEVRSALEVASVIGEEVSLAVLAEASRRSPAELLEALSAATAAGVLVDQPDRRFRFSHALVREAAYRDLPRTRRLELHAAVGRALERLHGDELDAPLAEIAHHFLAACPGELEAGPRYALRAAEQALARLAWEDAVAMLEQARAALELAPGLGGLRAEVLLALGLARIRAGDADRGKRLCQQAAELARRHGDGQLLARAALTYGVEITAGAVDPLLIQLLDEAQSRLPETEIALRARVKARLAAALQPASQPGLPIALAREAIALARGLADKGTLLEVLHNAMAAMMDFVPADERLPLNLEQDRLASELGDRLRALRASQRLVIDHLERGELGMMEARVAVCERLGRELPQLRQHWQVPLFRAARAGFEGRFADAERLAAEAAAIAAENGARAEGTLLFHRFLVLRTAERLEEAMALEPAVMAAWAGQPVAEDFLAVFAATVRSRSGDLTGVRARLAQVPASSPVLGHHEPCAMAALAEIYLALGDRQGAEALYPDLLPLGGRLTAVGLAAPSCDGAYDHLLGRLAAATGRLADGLAHLEAAVADLKRLGGRPALARSQYDLACLLRARGGPDDHRRARRLLEEAAAAAESLPLPGLQALLLADPQQTVTAEVPAPAPTGPAPGGLAFRLDREGEFWSLTCGDRVVRLKDSRSMRTLALLVAHPDREFHVLDLIAGDHHVEPAGVRDLGDAGELLDARARESYRRRLTDLRDALEEAESFGDEGRAARAREEIERLGAELSRAVGLGGRERRAAAAAERARVAVQRRIKHAIRRIALALPAVGQHLGWAVRTGSFCVYRPHRGDRDGR